MTCCITLYVHQEEGAKFEFREATMVVSDNYMDRWILSFTQSLIKFVTKEMAGEYFVRWTPKLMCCCHLVVCVCDMLIRFVTKEMAGECFVGWTSQLVCCCLVGRLHSHLVVCVFGIQVFLSVLRSA